MYEPEAKITPLDKIFVCLFTDQPHPNETNFMSLYVRLFWFTTSWVHDT